MIADGDPFIVSPGICLRSFAVKDNIFCVFEGVLDNLGSLKQHYGLAKNANEVLLVIEAYKALRDRAPYPPSQMVGHLRGSFSFIIFDGSTSSLFVASVSSSAIRLISRKASSPSSSD